MTRHPYGHDELDRDAPDLDRVADQLERYADASRGDPPAGLAARINVAIEHEPDPGVGWWGRRLGGSLTGPARAIAVVAVVVLAVAGAVVIGGLAQGIRGPNVGSSTSPSATDEASPSVEATPSLAPTPTPTPTLSPTVVPSPTETARPGTPFPTVTDDHGGGDDGSPRPSGSDNSGPGGGGSGSGSDGGSGDD